MYVYLSYDLQTQKQTLQELNIVHLKDNLITCSCSSSPYKCSSAGHVIAADVNIVNNEDLRSLILGGPKFREPTSFTWCRNVIHIMNPVEDYAMRWVKFDKEDLNTISEWVKSI